MNQEQDQPNNGISSRVIEAMRAALLAAVIITPLLYFRATVETHIALKELVIGATAIALFGAAFLNLSGNDSGRLKIKFCALDALMVVYAFFTLATVNISINKSEGFLAWTQIPSLLIIYFCVSRNFENLKETLPQAVSVSATVVALITLALSVYSWARLSAGGTNAMILLKDALVFPLGGNNFTAAFLTVALPATAGLSDGPGGIRAFKYKALAIQAAAITACFSRIAFVILIALLAVWSIGLLLKKRPALAWVGPGALLLGVAFSALLFLLMAGNVSRQAVVKDIIAASEGGADQGVDSMHMRLFWWKDTVNMIKEHPYGVGFGGFCYMFPKYRTIPETFISPETRLTTPHNDYLHIASESGYAGLAIFAGILALGFMGAAAGLTGIAESNREAAVFSIGALLIVVLYAIADFPLFMPACRLLFFIALGFAASFLFANRSKEISVSASVGGATIVALACGLLATDALWVKNFISQIHVLKQINAIENPAVSISEFEQAIKWNPEAKFAYPYAGSVYGKKGDCKKAISMFDRALEIDPNDYNAINYLGVVYAQCGRKIDALIAFQSAVDIYPNFANPHLNAGIVYSQQRDNKKARGQFERALELNNKLVDAYIEIAEMEQRAGNASEAAKILTAGLEVSPGNAALTGKMYELHEKLSPEMGKKEK